MPRRAGLVPGLRRLGGSLLRVARSGNRSPGIRLLRYHAFMLVLLDIISRIVAKALSFCERVDEGLRFDSEQALFETLIEEAVASLGENLVYHGVKIGAGEMVDEFFSRLSNHFAPKVSNCPTGNRW